MSQNLENFKDCKIVFCDSEESLEHAFKQGLRKNALIRTSSPALLVNKKLRTKAIRPEINRKRHLEFHNSVLNFVKDVYKKFINNKKFKDYAILIARQALLLQPKILQIASLTKNDFEEPRSIIINKSGNKKIDERINGMWKNFLESNRKNQILDAALEVFVKKGYSETSMNDIANVSGLSKGAIYHHYISKRELFLSLIDFCLVPPNWRRCKVQLF